MRSGAESRRHSLFAEWRARASNYAAENKPGSWMWNRDVVCFLFLIFSLHALWAEVLVVTVSRSMSLFLAQRDPSLVWMTDVGDRSENTGSEEQGGHVDAMNGIASLSCIRNRIWLMLDARLPESVSK